MCGIAGVIARKSSNKLLRLVVTMMMVLQTRGDEGCGIACSDGYRIKIEKGLGKVATVFTEAIIRMMNKFKPLMVMGHNLYTTSGSVNLENVHPQYLKAASGKIVFAYNGNVPNIKLKRKPLADKGIVFDSDGDTEFILDYIFEAAGRQLRNLSTGIKKFMENIPCSYSASLMIREKLFLFRDPYGNRPLFYGYIGNDVIAYASEDSALRKINAKNIREVETGTIVEFGIDGSQEVTRVFTKAFCKKNCSHCVFCNIYFARPDSEIFNLPVDVFRQLLGATLFSQCEKKTDVVISVPASGDQGSEGYAIACKRPHQILLLRDPSIDRTFILSGQRNREIKAKMKYSLLINLIRFYEIKSIMIIDDSIVRSTTMRILIKRIKDQVRKILGFDIKIFVGVLSPPIRNPCYYGIDMKDKSELIAAGHKIEEIRKIIGADGLYYLTLENLKRVIKALGSNPDDFCFACFDGNYKIPLN